MIAAIVYSPWLGKENMALHPDFQRWLSSRGLQPATLSVLQKESILQESTLKLLTDSDIDSLKEKHGISLGQMALLRSARGSLCESAGLDDDFEIIELEDVPTSMAAGHGGKELASRKDRHSSAGKNDRTVRGVCVSFTCIIVDLPYLLSPSRVEWIDNVLIATLCMYDSADS